jgi:hypothetical protein
LTFPCRWGCGTLLDTDPSITTASGKRIPLSGGIPHDCHMNPYRRGQKKTLAKAVSKVAIKRIEDHQILEEAKSYIQHVNTRLQHYKLTLSIVKKKQMVLEELL